MFTLNCNLPLPGVRGFKTTPKPVQGSHEGAMGLSMSAFLESKVALVPDAGLAVAWHTAAKPGCALRRGLSKASGNLLV